jgi:hypothetical protein
MMHSQGHQDMGMKGMHGGGSSSGYGQGQGYGGNQNWEMNPGSGW